MTSFTLYRNPVNSDLQSSSIGVYMARQAQRTLESFVIGDSFVVTKSTISHTTDRSVS